MDDDSDLVGDSQNCENDDKCEGISEKHERSTRIPITRVKTIMKTDSDLSLSSLEAVYLVTKATELFVEFLSMEAYKIMSQNKKKTLQKKDVDLAIEQVDAMTFLEGAFD
uniref:Transcription factor CBF/NF-Y/archaeal histone domain-containing protein n=1 Tax=Strigamia maritima TaxID=126957 RepID=T1JL69_STRMM